METKMKELVEILNNAAEAYYSGHESSMTDKEYDELYDELLLMEARTGIVLPESPTQKVGYEVISSLKKVKHEYPALSLDKTKDREYLRSWLGDQDGVLSWKCDGLTVVLTYDVPDHFLPYQKARLVSAVTRGDGYIGEDVTHNAKYIAGIPQEISYAGKITVRGEVMIGYEDFDRINETISDPDEKYKNPRNLTSGSLRLLDSKAAASRHMIFKAFELVDAENDMALTYESAFRWLEALGFNVVEYTRVMADTVVETIGQYEKKVSENDFPTDGLVLVYNDIPYGLSLGRTGKFPRNGIAFKWADVTEETILRDVEWSASASGLLNPVAVFDPVELEGTTVKRASLHNIRYLENMELGYGDKVTVYKSNMIIPQLDENLTKNGDLIKIPTECPVCGHPTSRVVSSDGESEFLYCTNPDCAAKHKGRFERLVCKDGLNVVGLAGKAIDDFLKAGLIHTLASVFHLAEHKDKIVRMEGYGEKSYNNLINSIENARHTTFRQLFYSLGIPGAGHDASKILEKAFIPDHGRRKTELLMQLVSSPLAEYMLTSMEGIGGVTARSIIRWFNENRTAYDKLLQELTIMDDLVEDGETVKQDLKDKTFVITGSLNHYENREALKAEIESRGGKVSGSVSKKTTYLINNDVSSTSGKNKKAKELNIPIISEEEYMRF